jgi:hypothetical protein
MLPIVWFPDKFGSVPLKLFSELSVVVMDTTSLSLASTGASIVLTGTGWNQPVRNRWAMPRASLRSVLTI